MSIEFGFVARIELRRTASLCLEIRLALLPQEFLEDDGVAGVGLEYRICDISEEWNQAYSEVQGDVHDHLHLDGLGKSSLNLSAGLEHHEGKEDIQNVAGTIAVSIAVPHITSTDVYLHWDDADYTA